MRLGMVLLMTMGLLAPECADAVIRVRSAGQLASAPEIKNIRPVWRSVSAGMALYEQCAEEYGITADHKDYLKHLYDDLWYEYLDIYRQLYEERVGYPPETKMVNDYTTLVIAEQKEATESMYLSIRSRGCTHATVRRTYEYLEKHRAQFKGLEIRE